MQRSCHVSYGHLDVQLYTPVKMPDKFDKEPMDKLEIRSVERGICPIATSTMNELFL